LKSLDERVAVVTGASGGIGRAIAVRLAQEGCHLALVDLKRSGLEETVSMVEALGRTCTCHEVDVSDSDAMIALAQEVFDAHGRVEILVNNAGVNVHGPFASHTVQDIDWILGVNVRGVMYGCHAFLPYLRQAGESHVVNVASLAGMVPFPLQSTYTASKFAVRGFSAALRMEWTPFGIGVTTVLPGSINTSLMTHGRSYDEEMSAQIVGLMERYGRSPESVAAAVVKGVRKNRAEVVLGPDAVLFRCLQWVSPALLRWSLGRGMAKLEETSTDEEAP
jgi:short-subunit dehydrogenase